MLKVSDRSLYQWTVTVLTQGWLTLYFWRGGGSVHSTRLVLP